MKEFWSNVCFAGRCIKIVVRDLWHKVFAVAVIVFVCGCINLYTRWPWSEPRIEETYQCTQQAAVLTVAASFPQIIGDSKSGFMWENCLTIPFLGFPCAVDTALEFCVDTVFVPFDWMVSDAREKAYKCSYSDDVEISPYALVYRQEIIEEATKFYLELEKKASAESNKEAK